MKPARQLPTDVLDARRRAAEEQGWTIRPGRNGPGVPSWSPDGRLAYFNTPGRPGGYTAEVWTMNADGSDKRRLYHSACCVSTWAAPIWSPDGQQIAFAASSAGGTYIINSDGSGLRRLTTAAADALAWQRKP